MSGYIGTQPVPQATQTRDAFTATSGQTSFATRGYTPNFLDVFLNGVKLAAADYTATNGSDVVLASGAVVNDILEVVAYTAFDTANVTGATDFTVTGAFTSQGIDDNGNATAITIDSSEKVLIGKTSAGYNVDGFEAHQNGETYVSRSGTPMAINRNSSDGTLLNFYKDGGGVGSIGVVGSDILFLANPDGTGCGLNFDGDNPKINPTNGSGSGTNGIVDLGWSGGRFKDAYLSGGVYLGGTGSANKLEDYEEGTWTPTNAGDPTGTISANGKYVKIGRQVTCHATMSITATFTNATIGGLPFNPHHEATLSSIHGAAIAIGSNIKMVSVNNGSGNLTTRDVNNSGDNPNGSQLIRFSITYQTNN